jgi:S-adenosylmethionine synthetase
MTMEAVAGKNPVSHVGKVYNLAAARIAAAIVDRVPGVLDASCVLVGRIGSPIDEPQLVDVRLALDPPQRIDAVRAAVNGMVANELARSRELPRRCSRVESPSTEAGCAGETLDDVAPRGHMIPPRP